MLWLYVLLATAGITAIVPTLLRALDDVPGNGITGFIGFTGTLAGLTGLFGRQIGVEGWTTLLAASTVGLVVGALHPELLRLLRPKAGALESDMVESRHNNH